MTPPQPPTPADLDEWEINGVTYLWWKRGWYQRGTEPMECRLALVRKWKRGQLPPNTLAGSYFAV